jgi:hypothetical protein
LETGNREPTKISKAILDLTFSIKWPLKFLIEEKMEEPIKILHVDNDYKVIYILIREGTLIKSTVPLEAALIMLKNEDFDLILSEPHNIAILTPINPSINNNSPG